MKTIDRFRGCLIGGAAGDALGYAVEFLLDRTIFTIYGPGGITEYKLTDGAAQISDDTQMTLFTAAGLLNWAAKGAEGPCAAAINAAYGDWYRTQTQPYPLHEKARHTWLVNVPGLFAWRAPGNTCMESLRKPATGTIRMPINKSRGCGGVMRVAPIGLFCDSAGDAAQLGAEAAALTHGHSMGYIPAAALAYLVHLLSHCDISMQAAAQEMKNAIASRFAHDKHIGEFIALIEKAMELAQQIGLRDLDAIRQLGQGWVGDEAFAIALYCALKYSEDFDSAVIAAVNHSGDSDSTGAIAGNIVGARVGLEGIPAKYLEQLELKRVILELADDLYHGGGPLLEPKYLLHTYGKEIL